MVVVGHVTKDGVIAGPRVLEHMVDTVLYFESDPSSRYTMIRSVKNRFGASGGMGVFVGVGVAVGVWVGVGVWDGVKVAVKVGVGVNVGVGV